MRKGLIERRATVALPGGELVIEWTLANRILMSGPVEMEYEGRLEALGTAPAGA
jgi:diaminopimelate epimerase